MTSEYIKEAYEKLRKKLGKQPSQTEFYQNTNVTPHQLLKGGFRTYSKLVEEMGDKPKVFMKDPRSEEYYLISYGNMIRKYNKIPSTIDWNFYKGKPVVSSYTRKFKVSNWGQIADKFFDFARDNDDWKDIMHLEPTNIIEQNKLEVKESEECYVYLMLDTKNKHYKIGISNEPQWRERTLQSQKPSIKLIASKKYINRRIAANIEKALHDSYSHKRKRGEWFLLDAEDIIEIRDTLA